MRARLSIDRTQLLTPPTSPVVRALHVLRGWWRNGAERSRAESDSCLHDGYPPFCVTCVALYIHMP
jgi:hypothetical protein